MKYLLRCTRLGASALLLLLASAQAVGASVSTVSDLVVVATIKPLHSLAAVVTEGVLEPRLLIDGSVSPHTFQLKPSHIKLVAQADLMLWAGEGVERFIPSLLKKFAPNAVNLELASVPMVITHKSRSVHADHADDLDRADDSEHTDDPDHFEPDYHLWLEPQNASRLVDALALQLGLLDAANADKYRANAAAFKITLATTIREIDQTLAAAKGQSYLIYHDSLQYFEKAFGLGNAIVVTSQPQMQAGAKRLKALRKDVAALKPSCIFAEPQFRSPALRSIALDLNLQTEVVDPIASKFDAGAALYTDWLIQTAETIAACANDTVQEK